jgi:uncharacterized protein (DUF1684 family)
MEPMAPDDLARHRASVEQVHARRDASLRGPMGWLSLVGLHWLRDGEQWFGSDPVNPIQLSAADDSIPLLAGSLNVAGSRVTVAHADAALTVNGQTIPDGLELLDEESEDGPTMLELGSLRAYLIRRGEGRLALRVKDTAASALREFKGLDHFPIDAAWRVTGRLQAAQPGATITVPDIVGDVLAEPTPGVVAFELGGAMHRLRALEAQPGHLWLIFGDATNGDETYGGGRFLVTGPVQPDDTVEIDFNLAYNPPCVFSPYATCPLPPDGNRLLLRVEAGEKTWIAPGSEH